jgi:hypothetical protein
MSSTDGREPEQRILLWCHRSRVYFWTRCNQRYTVGRQQHVNVSPKTSIYVQTTR